MRLAPAGVIDLLLGKVLEWYVDFHKLPKDQSRAISYVLGEVAKQVIVYREKFGHIVTFFIDGADLLAKENPHTFTGLVDKAKHFANDRTLQIIFVSSEVRILPLHFIKEPKGTCD